jgi:hypothetical protein
MRRCTSLAMVLLLVAVAAWPGAWAREIVDRIVARIEGDIITLSEVRELGALQQLAGRAAAASEDELLGQLIEQWIVVNDAAAARFPQPAAAEVDREIAALQQHAGTREKFEARLAALGLPAKAVWRLVERELYVERYLDYKFRPTVEIEPEALERYYHETLIPALQARKEPLPPLEKVSEQIHELLLQQEISRRSAEWLQQTRAQVHVEMLDRETTPGAAKKPATSSPPKDLR